MEGCQASPQTYVDPTFSIEQCSIVRDSKKTPKLNPCYLEGPSLYMQKCRLSDLKMGTQFLSGVATRRYGYLSFGQRLAIEDRQSTSLAGSVWRNDPFAGSCTTSLAMASQRLWQGDSNSAENAGSEDHQPELVRIQATPRSCRLLNGDKGCLCGNSAKHEAPIRTAV